MHHASFHTFLTDLNVFCNILAPEPQLTRRSCDVTHNSWKFKKNSTFVTHVNIKLGTKKNNPLIKIQWRQWLSRLLMFPVYGRHFWNTNSPVVMVLDRANGEPNAMTHSPGLMSLLVPSFIFGRFEQLILTVARSLLTSTSSTTPAKTLPSWSLT